MMLSLQNSINSRNGPGGNKNRSVWLRVGVTGVAFQAVNQPCGTQGSLAKSAVAGYIVRETVQMALNRRVGWNLKERNITLTQRTVFR